MKKHILPRNIIYLIVFFMAFIIIGCSRDDDDTLPVIEEHENLYEAMLDWYYWTDYIPEIDPSSYSSLNHVLDAVMYKEYDRWSFITDWDAFYAYISQSEMIGYGFGSAHDVEGQLRVSFVFNTVEMYEMGVRRSWVIEAVNGTDLQPWATLGGLLGPDEVGISNSFRFRDPDGETVEMTLEKQVVTMNSILHHEVIEQDGIKIGYMVLQGFSGTTEEELQEVFSVFKQEDIEELILDMRYNGGGLTSMARKVSSLIAGEHLAGEPFARFTYNANKQDRNRVDSFSSEENALQLSRLVTVGTRATASASEMVINGLKPYMDVVVVGDNTYGKPMGADVLRFMDNYALVPITINIKNADDEGDYFDGFPADVSVPDDLTRMFGDPEEVMRSFAVSYILTGSTKGMPVHETIHPMPHEELKGLRRWTGAW